MSARQLLKRASESAFVTLTWAAALFPPTLGILSLVQGAPSYPACQVTHLYHYISIIN